MYQHLAVYLPQDRLQALAHGETLPARMTGSALFADVSGFTPLTEKLTQTLGPRRGVEELTHHLNVVFNAIIAEVQRYGGSVISFAGDAITCWFDAHLEDVTGPPPHRAVACALAMQAVMQTFATIPLPDHTLTTLTLKVTITTGPAWRFVVGDANIQLLDALAGETITRLATGEQLAQSGQILADAATVQAVGKEADFTSLVDTIPEFFSITGLHTPRTLLISEEWMFPTASWMLTNQELRPWLLPAVYAREQSGLGEFLTELRPTVALFIRFAGMDYEHDPDAGKKLDHFIQRVQHIISHFDGTLLDLNMGDKGSYLYATFGAPTAHEDDHHRAAQTALALKNLPHELKYLTPLQIGLSQGTMRAGAYGGNLRRTYGVMGDEVNLAARLMEAAMPGEILVSGHVAKYIADHFELEPRPPLHLKGKSTPIPAFTLLATRQFRTIRLQEPQYALPMVGRQAEFQTIREKMDLALQGKGQIIGIVGEAGMGKSRLVAEVIRAAGQKGFARFGGACQSDSIHTAYLVWKAIWSALFGVQPELSFQGQIRLLEKELREKAPERVQAIPLVGALLNLNIPDNEFTQALEPKDRKGVLHTLLEECLKAAATQEPILIVVEDLQWIDALSFELLEELARALTDDRVCFVLAYRPPHARLVFPHLEALPHYTKIELGELNADECEQVIRAKLTQLYPDQGQNGVIPPVLAQKLMARAQGNPFYLEELINFLRDRGLNPHDPSDLDKIELPDSLHTLILSRIDQLTEREKTTLRVASVIGRLFRAAWLTGYYPALGGLPQVKPDLDTLHALDITLLETPEPELAYLFKHIVTHEVAYESLPFATRAHLHEQLAQYLEKQIAAGNLSEAFLLDTLVYHYSHSENQPKQREYLYKAAQMAYRNSAFKAAAEYYDRLLALTPTDSPERSRLARWLAEAYYRLSDFSAAQETLEKAYAMATTDLDRAAALVLLGQITIDLGEYPKAQQILTEAIPIVRASGAQTVLCRALYALGDVSWRLSRLEEAKDALNQSLEVARGLGDVTRELFALNRLGMVALLQDHAEAERLFTEVYTRAVAVGNRERAMGAVNNLGEAAKERQDYPAARDYHRQALALARELGAQQFIALFLINLADDSTQLGDLESARTGLREGLALALRLGAYPWVVNAVMYLGNLAYAEGKVEYGLALWGLARTHPAWSSDHQRELDAILPLWGLDPAVVEAGLAKGVDLDWDSTIQELLTG